MQVNIEQVDKLSHKAHFELPLDPIEEEVQTRLKKIAKNAKIQGFRPGKAPLKVIEKQHGDEVRQEVIHRTLNQAFIDVVKEKNLDIVGEPMFHPQPIEEADAKTLIFDVVFDIKPEITIGDLSGREFKQPVLEVTEAEVDKTMESLRKRHPEFKLVDRESQEGDRLTIRFVGTIEGVAFQGGTAEAADLVLGAKQFMPEFEQALYGKKAGETVTVDVNFPEDYHGKEVAGKTAQFEITVKVVCEPSIPPLDKEFATKLGVPDGDVNRLREDIKANLENEVANHLRERRKRAAIKEISDVVEFDLPETLVKSEQQRMIQNAYQELMRRGVSDEDFPLPDDKFLKSAQDRVKTMLLFDHIITKEGLEVKPDVLRERVEAMAKAYQQPEEIVKMIYANQEQLNAFRSAVLEDEVVDWIVKQMKVVDDPVPFNEILPESA